MANPFVREGIVGRLSPLLFLPGDAPLHFDMETGTYHLTPDSLGLQAAKHVSRVCGRGGAYRFPVFTHILRKESSTGPDYSPEEE